MNSVRIIWYKATDFSDHSCTVLLQTRQASFSPFLTSTHTCKSPQHAHKCTQIFIHGGFKTYAEILWYFFNQEVESNSSPREYGLALVTPLQSMECGRSEAVWLWMRNHTR